MAHFHELYFNFNRVFLMIKSQQRFISRFSLVFDFSYNFCFGLVLSIVVDEVLLVEGAVFVVNYDHALGAEGNATFVADVCSSECVVACNHDDSDLSFFELVDGFFCFWLELVLKDLETIKYKCFFSLLAGDIFIVCTLKPFAGYRQHSIPI